MIATFMPLEFFSVNNVTGFPLNVPKFVCLIDGLAAYAGPAINAATTSTTEPMSALLMWTSGLDESELETTELAEHAPGLGLAPQVQHLVMGAALSQPGVHAPPHSAVGPEEAI